MLARAGAGASLALRAKIGSSFGIQSHQIIIVMSRLFTQFVQTACQEIGANCELLSDEWLIRMQRGDQVHLTLGYGFDINSAGADRVGNDKVAQYALLEKSRIPAIAHHIVRNRNQAAIDRVLVHTLDPDSLYVVKPARGSSGRRVSLHATLGAAITYINSLSSNSQTWVVSPYEELIHERRFIILDDEILLAYEKTTPCTAADGMVFFNLSRGATAQPFAPANHEIELVKQASRACMLRLAAIDVVKTISGEQKIMEINSGIACELYARQSDAHYAEVQQIYRTIIRRIFEDS